VQLYSIFHREGDAGDHHALLNSIGPLRWYLDTRLDLGCGLQPEEMHVLHVIVACGHVLPMRPPPPAPRQRRRSIQCDKQFANRTTRVRHGPNEEQRLNVRGERVALGTGYTSWS
jgi:hypothetical protein